MLEKMYPLCTSVQSHKVSAALLYRIAHLNNLMRTPISIGSKIKTYRPDGNRMVYTVSKSFSVEASHSRRVYCQTTGHSNDFNRVLSILYFIL